MEGKLESQLEQTSYVYRSSDTPSDCESLTKPLNKKSNNENERMNDNDIHYEDILSDIGIVPYHTWLIIKCGISNAADSVEIMAISFVISNAKDDLKMTDFDEGVLSAVIFVGMMLGGWIWGSLSDQKQLGRKNVLTYSLLLNGIMGLLSAVAVNFPMLLILRFFSGIGVGGSIPVTFTYASEFIPKEKRGLFLGFIAISWAFAATLTSLFALAIIPNIETSIESWRIFLIPCSIPAFVGSFIFWKYVDKSPKFMLYTQKDINGCIKVLSKMGKQNPEFDASKLNQVSPFNNDFSINFPIKRENSSKMEMICSKIKMVWVKTKILFSKQHARAHILCISVWFFLSYGFYGLNEWMPTYFKNIKTVDEFTSTLITSAAQFPGAILSCYLLEYYLDRRTTLGLSIGLSALCLIAVPFLTTGWQIVGTLSVFNGINVMAWTALDVVSSELSPTFCRSTAFGLFTAFGRIGAICGNLSFGIFGEDSLSLPLLISGIMLCIGTVACLLLPQTKGKEID